MIWCFSTPVTEPVVKPAAYLEPPVRHRERLIRQKNGMVAEAQFIMGLENETYNKLSKPIAFWLIMIPTAIAFWLYSHHLTWIRRGKR